MTDIESFTAHFDQHKIRDLQERLGRSIFPDELSQSGWDLGPPLNDIQRLTSHWSTFDFNKAASQINELPQFQTQISCQGFDPLNIHFIHIRSSAANAIPLFFLMAGQDHFSKYTKLQNY